MSAKDKKPQQVRIANKRASFDYEFLEEYDAGIVLVGTEIKSIRAGKASLQDAYCYFSGGELYVRGMNVATYFWASLYIADNGFAKLRIALAKGKKEYDKRATIKEKDIRREMERE